MECLMYLLMMGVFHFLVFIVACAALGVLAIWQRGTFRRRAGRLVLFLGLLLLIGSVANGLWSCTVWGRLYFSTDYVFDFSPFWPITQELIDVPFGDMRGQLLGVSLLQLQLVWLLFAGFTWAATILLYRLICRRPPANKSVEPNRRPAAPVGAGQQFDGSSCEPPFRSAAVAHL